MGIRPEKFRTGFFNNLAKIFCIPLDLNIQAGLKETSSWKHGNTCNAASHVVQMIRNSYEAARTLGSSYLVLDRYFLTDGSRIIRAGSAEPDRPTYRYHHKGQAEHPVPGQGFRIH